MNLLDLQIAMDDIVAEMRKKGKSLEDIRDDLMMEVERACNEAEEEEEA